MSFLLSLLIVAAQPVAPIESRHPDAVEIFHCGFEEANDRDVDAWPDGWLRVRGPNHPAYLPIKIVATDTPEGRYALKLGLNGGAAAVSTPPIEVGAIFSYVLEGYLRTEGLKENRAFLSLTFYDRAGRELEVCKSEQFLAVPKWKKVRLGPLTAANPDVHTVSVGLHLEPSGDVADLKGAAYFDDIWLARLPRMSLRTNRADNVYTDGTQIDISCEVSGIFEGNPTMKCELVDAFGKRIGEPTIEHIESKAVPVPTDRSLLAVDHQPNDKGFAGSMHWKPAITDPGFYRARITLEGTAGKILERQLTLAVIEPKKHALKGEFGWALPQGDRPLSFAVLAQLLPQVGINWAKYPVWLSEKDVNKLDERIEFAERLGMHGIESVGLLVDPPADVRPQFGDANNLTAAAIFSTEPELWYKSLEPVTTRLSLQVHWWQLGADDDNSFIGDDQLSARIASVKKQLEQFGQIARVGFAWPMLNELPQARSKSWDFLCLSAEPPLTEEELASYLGPASDETANRWVALEPLSRDDYSLEVRAADLVHRMVAAKRHGASMVYIPNPFDAKRGLMNEDGTPSELLLPWRTAALALAGAEYLGSLTMSEGSENHVFSRDGQIVIMLSNSRNVEERIYLGDNVRQVDLWGRSAKPRQEENDQLISVGPLPTFLVDVSEPIVRWNMEFAFEKLQLPSVFGVAHENSVHLKNFFPQGTAGQIRLHTPEVWQTSPRVMNFKLAAGEEFREPLTIRLPFDATNGRYPVRVDFDIAADREYRFSAYRFLEVGLGDLFIEMSSHLTPQGDLEVVQYFTNNTDQLLSFKCSLYAPERRRLVGQVTRLGPQRDTKRYRFPNGKELIGKTISLRAEEVGGERTFNYHIIAKE